jgi:small-conductance mechanosensitive channel
MSLPFSIGDIVEVNGVSSPTEPLLTELLGQRGKVETMGLRWVKVSFEGMSRRFVIPSSQLRKIEDEDTHRF